MQARRPRKSLSLRIPSLGAGNLTHGRVATGRFRRASRCALRNLRANRGGLNINHRDELGFGHFNVQYEEFGSVDDLIYRLGRLERLKLIFS
jgi:hypothetical protein